MIQKQSNYLFYKNRSTGTDRTSKNHKYWSTPIRNYQAKMRLFSLPQNTTIVRVDTLNKVASKFYSTFHSKNSLPPALTNFVDHFPYDCWTRKPGTVVTYSMGPFGGIVAGTQLRSVCQVIQLILLPKVTHWLVSVLQYSH